MNLKKRVAALAAVLLVALAPLSASAETWATEDFSFQVPEDMLEFTLETPLDDPGWALAGVADAQGKLREYQEMGTLVNFVSQDGDTSILVMQKSSDYSQSVYNLSDLGEEERQQVLDNLGQSQSEGIEVGSSLYQGENGLWFYRIAYEVTAEDAQANELVYGTIVNGYALNFDIFRDDGPISQEQEDLLLSLVNSLSFTRISERPDTTISTWDAAVTIALLAVTVLAIVVPLVYFSLRNRRDKKRKAQLAERLSEYHRTHGDDTVEGPMRFANSTDCTKEAVHTFSMYQAYIKNLPAIAVGVAMCLVLLALAFLLDTEWWMKLVALAVAVYYGYKIATAGQNTEKIQRKVFNRGVSDVARYAFYDEAFRVSGVQSASVFPYFQITEVRRHGQYLYLYYGPENAYLVDQHGFSLGEYEDFAAFLKEKTGKNF